EERAKVAVGELSLGAHPPAGADLAAGIRDLSEGKLDRTEFLERFGHRGTNEMELAQPRWSETPEELDRLVHGSKAHGSLSVGVDPARIADEAKLFGPARDQFRMQ